MEASFGAFIAHDPGHESWRLPALQEVRLLLVQVKVSEVRQVAGLHDRDPALQTVGVIHPV